MFYLLIFLQLVLLGVAFWGIGYLWETYQNSKPGRVLYHGSDLKEQGPVLIKLINKYIGNKTKEYNLIEPGAGMATVAHYLAKRFPWKEVEAVEIGPFIMFVGKVRFMLARKKVHFIRKDLFKYSYPAQSVIYCYLFPSLLDRLYKEGAFKGSLVITLTFAIKDVVPTEEIPLHSWQNTIRVYDFR